MRYRDRDDDVTTLPILVDAFPHESRDGRIIDLDGHDVAVRILPLSAVEGIFNRQRRQEIDQEFNQAFKAVSEQTLNELKALVFLIQATRTRSHKLLMEYVKQKAPVEAVRAQENMSNLLARLGDRKTKPASESEKFKYLQDAVRSLFRRTRHPLSELSHQLNAQARRARFVLWWVEREGRFAPGLYCDNMASAVATALFSRIVSPQAVAICERCGNQFIRTKRAQRFCSLRCGNADRKARERERAIRRKSKQRAR